MGLFKYMFPILSLLWIARNSTKRGERECCQKYSGLRLPLTMVTHDLPSSLYTDILKVVVTAFLVLLQRAALLVTPSAVVALVRFTHCGKKRGFRLNQCCQGTLQLQK